MKEKGMYYATEDFANMIKSHGGTWNDTKHRPLVCLIQSTEDERLYWAIPMGKYNHRDKSQIKRLDKYLNYPKKDIRSCYYHVGRTSSKSIFFISDAIPITDKYILEPHVGGDGNHYIIKNKELVKELQRKLGRILSFENSSPNHFRQHITDIKEYLLDEVSSEEDKESIVEEKIKDDQQLNSSSGSSESEVNQEYSASSNPAPPSAPEGSQEQSTIKSE